MQPKLMEFGFLTQLAKWLEPLPDKSLPNLKLRTEILDILKIVRQNAIHISTTSIDRSLPFLHAYVRIVPSAFILTHVYAPVTSDL